MGELWSDSGTYLLRGSRGPVNQYTLDQGSCESIYQKIVVYYWNVYCPEVYCPEVYCPGGGSEYLLISPKRER